ncbi:hypothetical protein [Sinorhizobium alkalisoli]|uniref:hypothetical protein n=1 Tax=Sinorhizobium alkalisoli TaxID=1752398 RepID=UPI0012A7CD6E|nr:hypothetical protein [Sinorhizobium alkalisoli]QFI68691.1 hypothetical protein EKH55_3817 [Sinorhizobium alkalisoli]
MKVDINAIPKEVAAALNKGEVDLKDPASTLVLLKSNAVVGVTGFFSEDGKTLRSVAQTPATGELESQPSSPTEMSHKRNIGPIGRIPPADLTEFTL